MEITGATAVHPGFGFLSENAEFAQIVEEHGLIFIGPTPEHIRRMGDKAQARETAQELGLPVVPGSPPLNTVTSALKWAESIGYPLLIKAVSGGGGKGIKLVQHADDLKMLFPLAAQEAKANFKDDTLYLEKYIENPRHIEFQILGDGLGKILHFGERECSVQRRYQKIWEEAPSPILSREMSTMMAERIVNALSKLNYRGLGTVECLYSKGEFYFMEMNTRIQVEHPITEMITGIDLVALQIQTALGMPLTLEQQDIKFQGHAIECRINAENPCTFVPSPGKIEVYLPPGGLGVRVDSHLYTGYMVPPHYDSMLGKLIVHGPTRNICLNRLRVALGDFIIQGIPTLIPLHLRLCEDEEMHAATYHTKWLEEWMTHQTDYFSTLVDDSIYA
jgi:acetyl-CoA carboxylase biotin carboxylase subunit